jgi:endo-1,4-beta-xylanase
MTNEELVATAEEHIQSHRTARVVLRFANRAGQPLKGVGVHVHMLRHEFKLGANAFRVNDIRDERLQEGYNACFGALLNYATLPFYWGMYETKPGRTSATRLTAMALWCKRQGITTKGHPLVWHEVFPTWAETMGDTEVMARLLGRVKAIVSQFKGLVDIWDVVNEATVSSRFGNTVGRWIAREGAAAAVTQALAWANEANPAATLLYNDFNISPAFERLVQAQLDCRAPVKTIGIQSHMHKEEWPLVKLWQVCETYSRFGLPLHFTEATVLSGRAKAADDEDWHAVHADWPTTAEGEAHQLAYGQQFYTLLFSHPAVEAITWWDFSDNGSWQGAPAGLVRADMTPKPLYDWLMDAFHRRWTTDAQFVSDENGCADGRFFFGTYEARSRLPSGDEFNCQFTVARHGPREVSVTLG